MSESDAEKIRESARTSLYFLCTQVLGYKDWDKIHDDMEVFLARPSQRKILLIPRLHLKTTIATVAYSVQRILKDPNIRILIANQIWEKARDMLFEIKEQLTRTELPKLFGEFKSDRWNTDDLLVKQRTKAFKEPTISTTGVEAETTGGHYNLILLDDLQGLQNCQTYEQREKVKRFYRSMVNLVEPTGQIVITGTRWHLDDVYGYILDKERAYYDVMVRTVTEKGKVIFPKKFNKTFDARTKTWIHTTEPTLDYVKFLKETMTREEFNSQYMNDPIDEETQIFKKDYFKYYDRRPEKLNIAMTVDPAISEKRSADFTAINVSGMDEKGDLYILDTLKGHWNPSEAIETIFTTYLKWRPTTVGIETVAYQHALKHFTERQMADRGVHFPITEIRIGTNESKEFRIKALEPYYRMGRVRHAAWMKSLEEEALSFPKGRHDDELDALSMQLQLLLPGDSPSHEDVPPGSWEDAFQIAQNHAYAYRDFFNERNPT